MHRPVYYPGPRFNKFVKFPPVRNGLLSKAPCMPAAPPGGQNIDIILFIMSRRELCISMLPAVPYLQKHPLLSERSQTTGTYYSYCTCYRYIHLDRDSTNRTCLLRCNTCRAEMLSSTNVSAPHNAMHFVWSCDKVYHKHDTLPFVFTRSACYPLINWINFKVYELRINAVVN